MEDFTGTERAHYAAQTSSNSDMKNHFDDGE